MFSFTGSPGVCPVAGVVFGVLDIFVLHTLQYITSSYVPSVVHVAGFLFSFTGSPAVCPVALSTLFVLDIL